MEDDRKAKKKRGRRGAFDVDAPGDGGGGLFDDEAIAHSKKKKTKDGAEGGGDGGEAEGRAERSSYHFREFDPSKRMGRKKKSVNKFKSKSKYKRR